MHGGVNVSIIQKKRKEKPQTESPEHRQLLADYYETVSRMHQVRNMFENITEPELIEACVYEMRAVQAQYSYLLSRIKKEKLTAEAGQKWHS